MGFVSLLQQSPGLFAAATFVIGLLIGSFLNVVIYRLPKMLEREWRAQCAELSGRAEDAAASGDDALTLVSPRSHCPACKAPVRAIHNIPVLSWLALRGRCASCRARIPVRYPLVELTTAILSAAVAWHFGFGFEAGCALLVIWLLIPLTGIDADHQLLPDAITLPLLWLGLLASLGHDPAAGNALPAAPRDAILGAAAGYLLLWSVFHAFKLLTGKEGMGFGDFKLFAALGAWLGWQMLPLIILLSAFSGAVIGVLMIVLRGRDRNIPIPFGPYLAAAGWIALMWGPQLVGGYLSMTGLGR